MKVQKSNDSFPDATGQAVFDSTAFRVVGLDYGRWSGLLRWENAKVHPAKKITEATHVRWVQISLVTRAALRIACQILRQPIEAQPDSATRAEVAMHGQPNLQRNREFSMEHRNEILVPPRNAELAWTNSEPGA
jgi:hypothetical protein